MAETAAGSGVARERGVALRVLRRVDDGAYADRALAAEARRADLDPRSRAQATRLAYGAVQRRRTLDWLIDGALDRPAALEPAVRDILRIGAYEIAFSDGVPDHAVVDQAVRQARALRGPKARVSARAGVVNAVMRRIASDAGERLATLEGGGADTAALRYSMPDWIAERLVASLGSDDAMRVMEAADEPAESALRWNRLRGPRAGLEAELPEGWRRDPLLPEAYVVPGGFALEDSAAWARGLAMGQSRASQLVAHVVDPRPGERILDLCAAPGAKATHIVALSARRGPHHGGRAAAGPGPVAAGPRAAHGRADGGRRGRRAHGRPPGGRLRRRARGPALHRPRGAVVASGRPLAPPRGGARAAHAPAGATCCGRALALVRPGGRVVYSTCTLISPENEDVVAAAGAPLDDLGALFSDYAHPRFPGALLTLPHRHGTDGFFIARLRRPAGAA